MASLLMFPEKLMESTIDLCTLTLTSKDFFYIWNLLNKLKLIWSISN